MYFFLLKSTFWPKWQSLTHCIHYFRALKLQTQIIFLKNFICNQLTNEAVKCNMVLCTTLIERGKVIEGNTHMYLQRIIVGCFCRVYIEF